MCDHELLEELMALGFPKKHENVVFIGPNGVGKNYCHAHCHVIRSMRSRIAIANPLKSLQALATAAA
ncbi:ATP-binding protein [Ferrovum sp.]|uniref:ATP-binding protein n=1 Tax=Ferrovum sp. TaxID=2609467 RepID=UPI003450EC83